MSRSRTPTLVWTISLVLTVACSAKTEHGGSSSDGPAPPSPAAGPTSPRGQSDSTRHLLMVVELEPATHVAKTLSARSVELPLPRRRGPAPQEPWRVEVLAADGRVLFAAPLADATTLRGEFRDEKTGELKGVAAQKRVAAVTLRLPWLDGASVVRLVDVTGGGVELARVAYPEVGP